MSSDPQLNGTDYLMLGFDHELRSRGYAGNSCQVVLELASAISPEQLRQRVDALVVRFPILAARPSGWFRHQWKIPARPASPTIRVHRDDPGLRQNLLNEPLAVHLGQLMRFDLIERAGGWMDVVFTWAHTLMDAPAAEYFLAAVGREDLPIPETAGLSVPKQPLGERWKRARNNLKQIDDFAKHPPRSPPVRHPDAPRKLQYRVDKFSAEETACIRANAGRLCGALGKAQFNTAVSFMELHRLHERIGCPSPGYVLPVPVGLRPKGTIAPLFSNQVGMMMLQALPEQLDATATVVASIKTQIAQIMRGDLVASGRILSELVSFLPLPLFMRLMKHGLRGEICSLFYGDTAAANINLTTFLGAPIEDFVHVAAVTPSPGIGVIFYEFRGLIRVTTVHAAPVLDETEAAEFAAAIRKRLLEP